MDLSCLKSVGIKEFEDHICIKQLLSDFWYKNQLYLFLILDNDECILFYCSQQNSIFQNSLD